jgi:hypothetical protein
MTVVVAVIVEEAAVTVIVEAVEAVLTATDDVMVVIGALWDQSHEGCAARGRATTTKDRFDSDFKRFPMIQLFYGDANKTSKLATRVSTQQSIASICGVLES